MPIFHKNCYGQTYVLHGGKTKTGKPRYYMSQSTEGNLAESLPDGYEIYEKPGGTVYVRKIPKTPILPHELQYVQDKVAPLNFLGIKMRFGWSSPLDAPAFRFLSPEERAFHERYRTRFEAEIRGNEIIIYEISHGRARPIMKFALNDEENREYVAHRWCFKGRIDDWIRIGKPGQLRDLVDKYCPALVTDDFFDLW